MDRTAAFYSQPSYVQRGGGLPVYGGSRRQRGGNVLGAIAKHFMPFISGIKGRAIQRAKTQGFGLAKDVIWDAIRGRDMATSLKTHGLRRVKQLGKDVLQDAVGTVTKPISRKRAAVAKRIKRPLKRRRKANF